MRRFSNGDLLFSKLVEGTFCLDPATGKATVAVNAEIIGGTGRFEGATGHYEIVYEVTALLPDPTGGIAHGAFVGTVTADGYDRAGRTGWKNRLDSRPGRPDYGRTSSSHPGVQRR